MPIDLVTRAEWNARPPKGSHSPLNSTRGVKVHYTGGRVDPRIVDDHDRCVAAVKSIQSMHMDGNGWIDIGYSMVACPHRKVFVGRGKHVVPAANGAGLNSGHYAVLGLVGNAGLVVPPDDMLLGILDAIEYLRREGGAGREIAGHRDGYSTACPGPALYGWVKRGAPRPGGGKPVTPVKPLEPVEPPPFKRELRLTKPMMHGDDVKHWQQHAARLVPGLKDDRWYGKDSAAACRRVQKLLGIPVTGVVDEETWLVTHIVDPADLEEE